MHSRPWRQLSAYCRRSLPGPGPRRPGIQPGWVVRAGRAAAAAVAAGRPDRAVELLEQTRGVLVAETLDARSSDLTRLRSHPSGLADEFDELRARIDAMDPRPYGRFRSPAGTYRGRRPDPCPGTPGRLRSLGWAHRTYPGHRWFREVPSTSGIHQLARQARRGPVVFIYSSPPRCDALILTDEPGTPVRLVPLVDLTEEDAYRQANRLVHAQRAAARPAPVPVCGSLPRPRSSMSSPGCGTASLDRS